MTTTTSGTADGYESFYREFGAPWMQRLRRDAYGEDIGQHSWVTWRRVSLYRRRCRDWTGIE